MDANDNLQEGNWKESNDRFAQDPVSMLKNVLIRSLVPWRCFPIMFRDFYKYYPRFNLKFEEIEFRYLDYWIQLPKVFDSLLGELLIRDAPLREVLPAEHQFLNWFSEEDTFPPTLVESLSKEELHKHVIEYLLSENPDFYKVINLYLNSRNSIKDDCIKDLEIKGLKVTDQSLVEYFLGYYIFKGVSLEALRFCVANMDLNKKDFLKPYRDAEIREWESMSEEDHLWVINEAKKGLKAQEERNRIAASKTHEEKMAAVLKNREERAKRGPLKLEEIPHVMIPKVLVEDLVKKDK